LETNTSAEPVTIAEPVTFADLGLSAKVLEAVTSSGYTIPTPIQAKAIPIALTGRDVLGIAQTGTGKTASFTLPMICRLETGRARARMPRSLILAPTRELAAQVAQAFDKYGVNHKLDVALLIGGVSMDEQTRKLERGVDVLIATPGRLLDHFQRGRILLMGVEILVIDEADRMLDMGFIPDIEKICKLLPPQRQTLFFSATMPPEITRLVHTFMRDPERIEAAPPATTAKTITQRFVYSPTGEDWDKREILRAHLRTDGVRNAIIFCNRKVDVAILLKSLVKHGFNAGGLHGDMEQRDRMATLDKFRSGEIAFLVASDVAARGLDIPDVSHVFNFDLPRDKDDYVHRIGRTGRAGKEGNATSIVAPSDLKQFLDIQKMTLVEATWLGTAPTEEDYADAGKRKRGRGGAPAAGRGGSSAASRGGSPSGRGAPSAGRGERSGASGGDREKSRGQPSAQADRSPAGSARPERAPRVEIAQPVDDAVAVAVNSDMAAGQRPGRPPRQQMDRDTGADEGASRPSRGGRGDRNRQGRSDRPRSVDTRSGDNRSGRNFDRNAGRDRSRVESNRGGDGPAAGAELASIDGASAPVVERMAAPAQAQAERSPRPARPERAQSDRAQSERGRSDRSQSDPSSKPTQAAPAHRPAPRDANRDRGHVAPVPRNDATRRSHAPPHPQAAHDGDNGFADNVPAFLRRPSRPAKAANDS